MSELFFDTSGWANLIDAGERFHRPAKAIFDDCLRRNWRIVTTSLVLTELIAVLTSSLRLPRPTAIAALNAIKSSPGVEIVFVDLPLDNDAWQLLMARTDKLWSLVDCATSIVMRQRGIPEALTTDHHFEQAGFVRLLK